MTSLLRLEDVTTQSIVPTLGALHELNEQSVIKATSYVYTQALWGVLTYYLSSMVRHKSLVVRVLASCVQPLDESAVESVNHF